MEEVQGAGLAGAEPVVIDRPTIPAAAVIGSTKRGQDLVERHLLGHHQLAFSLGAGRPPASTGGAGRRDGPSQGRAVDVAAVGTPAGAREVEGGAARVKQPGRR